MKKFNANTITDILNDRFAAGVGYSGYKSNFEVEGNSVVLLDIDRGTRHDYLTDKQIAREHRKAESKFKNVLDLIKLTLEYKKYSVNISLDVDYKGFVCISINKK